MSALPNGWQVKTLGEVAVWGSGGTPQAGNPAYYGGSIPWAIIGDLNDGIVSTTEKSITEDGLANSSAKLVPAGAILIAMYGSIGKMGIAGVPMATNQAIAFALPNQDLILPTYLFWFLSSQRELFLSQGKGATQQNISQTLLKAWQIPVPPLDEQRRIVETLDDHLSRLDKTLVEIQHQKPKVSVAYQEAIDRIYWADTQVLVPLRDFGDWVTGATPSTKNQSYFGGDIPFVTPPEVKNSLKVTATKRTLTHAGGLQVRVLEKPAIHLVCIGTVGKLGFSEGLAATNQQITSLMPSVEVDFDYALDLFSSREAQGRFRKASGKSNMPMLSKGSLLKIEMPLPSLEIQKRLKGEAHSLRTAEAATIARFQKIENQIVQLRRAIMHFAFQGKLGIAHG